MNWQQIKKIVIVLKCFLFILHKNSEPFLDQIMTCNEKCILYDNWPAQWLDWDDQLCGWTEKKLQSTSRSQPCIRKRSWSLFGGRLPVWPATVFESQWNYYIWEVCSVNWWDAPKTEMPAASIGQQKGPNSSPWQPYSPDLSPTGCHFFKHQQNASTGSRKYFPRVRQILKHGFLHYRNKQTFLIGKNVLLVMVPTLITKNVFEPSYNGLKFMVQNCNYFCNNLNSKSSGTKTQMQNDW